jgi:PGDYG protein
MSSPEIAALLDQAQRYQPCTVVSAHRLVAALTWRTDRGAPMRAEPGDWELTDEQGNRWTVEPETFARSYRRQPDGRYAKHELVDAVQLTYPLEVPTTEGVSTARIGDWLLRDAAGAVWPVPDQQFRVRYRPVDRPRTM